MKKSPETALTPMMKQYFDMKAQHPDAVLLFRCGDFYEAYGADAVLIAGILGITLTRRNNGKGDAQGMEMSGFPHHSLDTYLPRLVRAGKRVAICDQLEDPKQTKKLVKRGITELVTPGISMSDNMLNTRENNFLSALVYGNNGTCGVAFLDISTGEFMLAEGLAPYIDKLLAGFSPKELLLTQGQTSRYEESFRYKTFIFEMDAWAFNPMTANERLLKCFDTASLKGFGVEGLTLGQTAAGAVLAYLDITGHTQTEHIRSLRRIDEEGTVHLDRFTIRNLELVQPANGGEPDKCLLHVLDRTTCPMGTRLLRRWVIFPLKDKQAIEDRLSGVEHFFRYPQVRDALGELLEQVGDMERMLSKVAVRRASPRDLIGLLNGTKAIGAMQTLLRSGDADTPSAIRQLAEKMDACPQACQLIEQWIKPNPPAVSGRPGTIADGVNAELDELRHIAYTGKDYLLQVQQREMQETGIPSLKIGFNSVFGYYIEVRNPHRSKVPSTWIRRQTITEAERYITPELKEYESKILGAEEKILVLENTLYAQLLTNLAVFIPQMKTNALLLAELDCLRSFALVARERKYTRPHIAEDSLLLIRGGRHPVIEAQMSTGEQYVPNDIELDPKSRQILVITGPNMSGKSALLRQTALICLMAQMGSFVPAENAHIGLVDKVFTRVGASDNLAAGESTFMVEMQEAAGILHNATPRSLVLFDELGRGTSTYDGISIAWAIVEYLHEQPQMQARTLFATHYHELNEMASTFTRIRNYHVAVREVGDKVIFLRKLLEGGSEHSFGIHVAKMAGMPHLIVERADQVLAQLEANAPNSDSIKGRGEAIRENTKPGGVQLSFFQLDDPVLVQIRDEIMELNIDNLSPLEALNKLNEIKKIVRGR
jgi:DNA mismatch repair protein MutS